MRRILIIIMAMVVLSVPVSTIFSADYFIFDKETNKILFMGANDTQFMEKIDIEKNPNLMMPTNDPDEYLAIFAPKVKKGKEKNAQKGQLILFNVKSGKTEDLVDLGFGPFNWTYTDDHKHFFITYRPMLTSDYFELLHYNIEAKTSETMANFAKKINDLVVSADGSRLYVLIPGDEKDKDKTPSEVQVISFGPLAVEKTLPMDVNPQALFALSPEKFVVIDADEKNNKKSGDIKVFKSADCSLSDDFKFDAPYKVKNYLYKDYHTLITMVDAKVDTPSQKSFACKITSDGMKTTEIPDRWHDAKYYKDSAKDYLFLFTVGQFIIMDYTQDKLLKCKIDLSSIYYNINYLPETNLAILFPTQSGNVKFIDLNLNEPKLVESLSCGRTIAKFGNFLSDLVVSVALSELASVGSMGYYNIYAVNLFHGGVSVATVPDNSKYYILSRNTRDITIIPATFAFEKPIYIVPQDPPLAMYQVKRPALQILIVSGNEIYQLNTADDSLKSVHAFKELVNDCLFFEGANRLIILTDRDLLVIDPATLEVKNDLMLWGDPDQKYTRLKKGEQRYYFIPTL